MIPQKLKHLNLPKPAFLPPMTGREVSLILFSTGELAITAVAAALVARRRCNSILCVRDLVHIL